MSGASLSPGAWEIMRALAMGVELREFETGWQAVGPWQEPSSSGVDPSCIGELLEAGFVAHETRGVGRYASITKTGKKALAEKNQGEMRAALEWVKDQ